MVVETRLIFCLNGFTRPGLTSILKTTSQNSTFHDLAILYTSPSLTLKQNLHSAHKIHSLVFVWPSEQTAITLVNTQNVSVTKIVDSSSIQRAESKYGLRIRFLALVVMIYEV
jgi:hypothetical protein